MLITQERLKEICTYDPDTGIFEGTVNRGKKYKVGNPFGKTAKKGYLQVTLDGRTYRLHRLAWLYVYGVHPDVEIDHKNCITHDNRIENLRLADRSQQAWNRRGKPGRDLPKNVAYHKKDNLYVVFIVRRRELAFCKSYKTLAEAEESAIFNSKALHGEFHRS